MVLRYDMIRCDMTWHHYDWQYIPLLQAYKVFMILYDDTDRLVDPNWGCVAVYGAFVVEA